MKKLWFFIESYVSIVCLFLLVSCSSKEKDSPYMAVCFEDSEMWSIVDVRTGEVIGKDAFREIPRNFTDKMFSVETPDGKYECYSIDDINNPVGGTVFSAVGRFDSGRANAVREGAQISRINEKGEDVYQFSKEIDALFEYNDGLAKYVDKKKHKVGFVDENGNVVIPAIYANAYNFSDGYAIVLDSLKAGQDVSDAFVINKKGEKLYKIDTKKYKFISGYFTEGLMAVEKDDRMALITPEGKEVLSTNQMESTYDLDNYYKVQDGKFIFKKNGLYGLMNIDGDVLVRARYKEMKRVGKDRYVAEFNEKFGVVNSADEKLLQFDYLDIIGTSFGTYFVSETEGRYFLVNEKGEELTDNVVHIAVDDGVDSWCQSEFVDIDYYVNELNSAITTTNVFGVSKQTTAAMLGKELNLDPQYMKYQKKITLTETLENVQVEVLFENQIVEDITELVSYGYYMYYQTVGQKFNDQPAVSVSININLKQIHCDKIYELLSKRLVAKGFTKQGDVFVSPNGLEISFIQDSRYIVAKL